MTEAINSHVINFSLPHRIEKNSLYIIGVSGSVYYISLSLLDGVSRKGNAQINEIFIKEKIFVRHSFELFPQYKENVQASCLVYLIYALIVIAFILKLRYLEFSGISSSLWSFSSILLIDSIAILIHEIGHKVILRLYGLNGKIYYSPLRRFGATDTSSAIILSKYARVAVYLGGNMATFCVCLAIQDEKILAMSSAVVISKFILSLYWKKGSDYYKIADTLKIKNYKRIAIILYISVAILSYFFCSEGSILLAAVVACILADYFYRMIRRFW